MPREEELIAPVQSLKLQTGSHQPSTASNVAGLEVLDPEISKSDPLLPHKAPPVIHEPANDEQVLLERWHAYVRESSSLQKARILTDELRRGLRMKRKAVLKQMQAYVELEAAVSAPSLEPMQARSTIFGRLVSMTAELEADEERLDTAEGEIIQTESSIGVFLPHVQGINADISPQFLIQNGVEFGVSESSDASPSVFSDNAEQSQPLQRYNAKLTEVQTIEDEIQELREDEKRVRDADGTDLDHAAQMFLHTLPSANARLRTRYKLATKEMEELRDELEFSEQLSDRSGGPSIEGKKADSKEFRGP